MKFQQYLTEGRSKDIKKEEFERLLTTRYRHSAESFINNKNGAIFRGIFDANFRYALTNPLSGAPRTSANTTNEYTLFVDNHPSWKQYPKRSRSIIASSDIDATENFGNPYIVFPMNGTKIGMCSSSDFWGSFDYMEKTINFYAMDDFNNSLAPMLSWVTGNRRNTKNWATMSKAMSEFDKNLDRLGWDTTFEDIYGSNRNWRNERDKWKYAWKGSLMATIADVLDPSKNDFELKTAGNTFDPDVELWIGGPSLLISLAWLNDDSFSWKGTQTYIESVLAK